MNDLVVERLARWGKLRKFVPTGVRLWIRRRIDLSKYDEAIAALSNPYVGTADEWSYQGSTDFKVGIIFDPSHYHQYYMMACHDMGVSYQVIDIRRHDWLEVIRYSDCEGFLIWPLLGSSILKEMTDERVEIMEKELNLLVFPSYREIRLLDNKRYMYHWLKARGYPIADFWDFYDFDSATQFVKNANYPLVFKSVHGGTSSGVVICRKPSQARKLVEICFNKGFTGRKRKTLDKQHSYILFQEYIDSEVEHRLVKVGESYFYRVKHRKGDFHSGAGAVKWGSFREDLFNLTRNICAEEGFESMNIDFFEHPQKGFVINELHTLFGGNPVQKVASDQEKLNGRYYFNEGRWIFQPGYFYRNLCANLRVEILIKKLGKASVVLNDHWKHINSYYTHFTK